MREIKFRAWDKEGDCFVKHTLFLTVGGEEPISGMTLIDEDLFVLQQYTGLKDKNEVEIYEGDILGYPDDEDDKELTEVRWAKAYSGEQWCEFEIRNYSGKDVKPDEPNDYYGGISQNEYKIVVGNIFERVDK